MNDLRCTGGQRPTWRSNLDRREEFLYGTNALLVSRNVPDRYVGHVLGKEENYRRIVSYAGALEARKATFAEQQMAVADLIFEWWLSNVHVKQLMEICGDDGVFEKESGL
jgi:hypothetical protein